MSTTGTENSYEALPRHIRSPDRPGLCDSTIAALLKHRHASGSVKINSWGFDALYHEAYKQPTESSSTVSSMMDDHDGQSSQLDEKWPPLRKQHTTRRRDKGKRTWPKISDVSSGLFQLFSPLIFGGF